MAELTYRDAVARGHRAGDGARPDRSCSSARTSPTRAACSRPPSGCSSEFGPERVRDTPISEQAILGAAMGAAMTGLRPIAEIMFSDFFAVCWDIVANEIAKSRYMTDGQVTLPAGDPHGQRRRPALRRAALPEPSRTGRWPIPGLKVVAPSTPADVIGLLAAAVRDPDPVLFFEHKGLYAHARREVPDGEIVDTLGTRQGAARGRRRHDRRARGHGAAGARGGRAAGRRRASRPTVIDVR